MTTASPPAKESAPGQQGGAGARRRHRRPVRHLRGQRRQGSADLPWATTSTTWPSHSTFEETTYLLWHGRLPTRAELTELEQQLQANRALPPEALDLMRRFPQSAHADGRPAHHRLRPRSCGTPQANDDSDAGQPRQGPPPDGPDGHHRRRLAPPALRAGADPAQDGAQHGRGLPLHAHRGRHGRHRGAHPGRGPDPARRPRAERLHLRRPGHRGHALGHALGHHQRHRRPHRPPPRRGQRGRDPHAAGDGRPRPGGALPQGEAVPPRAPGSWASATASTATSTIPGPPTCGRCPASWASAGATSSTGR